MEKSSIMEPKKERKKMEYKNRYKIQNIHISASSKFIKQTHSTQQLLQKAHVNQCNNKPTKNLLVLTENPKCVQCMLKLTKYKQIKIK